MTTIARYAEVSLPNARVFKGHPCLLVRRLVERDRRSEREAHLASLEAYMENTEGHAARPKFGDVYNREACVRYCSDLKTQASRLSCCGSLKHSH